VRDKAKILRSGVMSPFDDSTRMLSPYVAQASMSSTRYPLLNPRPTTDSFFHAREYVAGNGGIAQQEHTVADARMPACAFYKPIFDGDASREGPPKDAAAQPVARSGKPLFANASAMSLFLFMPPSRRVQAPICRRGADSVMPRRLQAEQQPPDILFFVHRPRYYFMLMPLSEPAFQMLPAATIASTPAAARRRFENRDFRVHLFDAV